MKQTDILQMLLNRETAKLKQTKYPWENPIQFFEEWAGADLYPNQRLLLKLWNLQTDFNDYEQHKLQEWIEGFKSEEKAGVTPNVLEKIEYLKSQGHEWFPTVISVMGRRAGKTFLTGLQLSYCLACYLFTDGFGIKEEQLGHEPNLIVMATTQTQAQGTIFTDLYKAVLGNQFFDPYLISASPTKMEFRTLSDALVNPEITSLKARAVSSNTAGSRGWAIPFFAFDEGFFALGGESSRSGDEAIRALLPSLTQFYPHSMAIFPSSPRTRTGRLYELYEQSQNSEDKSIFVSQLPSWAMYENSDKTPIAVEPDPNGTERQKEEWRKEITDPMGYRREYRAQFADSSYAYLNPDLVKAMFTLSSPTNPMPNVNYKMHCDPARVNDDFALMVAHMDGQIMKTDFYNVYRASQFPGNQINYNSIEEDIQSLLLKYRPSSLTFDQFNSAFFIDRLRKWARDNGLQTSIYAINATATYNEQMYQSLKLAVNEGKIKAYEDKLNIADKDRCLLEASLDMVQERVSDNSIRVYKPRIRGYGHLDLVDCLGCLNLQFREIINATENKPNVWSSWNQFATRKF